MSSVETRPTGPVIAPLAKDRAGRPIKLPGNAVAWQVRRHTRGRPRMVLDGNKQPMQWPLDYDLDDADEILSAGTYRLDAVDDSGDMVGVTVTITLGDLRNGVDDNDSEPASIIREPLGVTVNEVRLVLEANVRSTELAFRHNERNLELGLRMAETLRDGIQVLASSQSDWIKAISSSKGFFRSPTVMQLPAPVAETTSANDDYDDESDDDHGEESDEASQTSLIPGLPPGFDVNQVLGQALGTMVGGAVKNFSGNLGALFDWRKARPPEPPAPPPPSSHTGGPPKDSPTSATESRPRHRTAGEAPLTLTREQQVKLFQVNAQLTSEERELMRLVLEELKPTETRMWLKYIDGLSVPETLAYVRAVIAQHSAPPSPAGSGERDNRTTAAVATPLESSSAATPAATRAPAPAHEEPTGLSKNGEAK